MTATPFYPVRLLDRWQEASHLHALRFEVTGTPVAESFEAPGQYVQLKAAPEGAVGYFAT